MIKFNRNYRITIDGTDQYPETIVIEYPMTLQFTVDRDMGTSLNTMTCQIFNLNEETRRKIFQDRYGYFQGLGGNLGYRRITLEAGYGTDLSLIFAGNLFEASSARQGSNIITFISCRDGGFDTNISQMSEAFKPGTTMGEVLQFMVTQFPNLEIGAAKLDGETLSYTFKRGVSISDNVWDAMQRYFDNNVFIDQEKVHLIEKNQYIEYPGQISLINADTGLLNTPRRNQNYLSIETLFEPRIKMGQMIALESTIQPIYNGTYKVCAIMHAGDISGSISGQCRTRLGLLIDGQAFGKFEPVPLVKQ